MKKIFVLIAVFVLAAGPLLAQNQIIDSVLFIVEGTTSIKSQAYYGKTNFNKVVIPESVKKSALSHFTIVRNSKKLKYPLRLIPLAMRRSKTALRLQKLRCTMALKI